MTKWSLFLSVGLAISIALAPNIASAQLPCNIVSTGIFPGENSSAREKVRLVRSLGGNAQIGVFSARLTVNTDGAPTSYHPDDLLGQTLALNRMRNGLVIRRDGTALPCRPSNCDDYSRVFGAWRSSGYAEPPLVPGLAGITISWLL
jgi:hypothetical protein